MTAVQRYRRKNTRVKVKFRTRSGKSVSFLAKPVKSRRRRSVRPKGNRKVAKSRSK